MGRRDSRSLIASAARAEFSEHGYAGARVERIARLAGVNKQLVFYYFGSKAGLYQAIMEGAAGEVAPAPTEPPLHHAGEQLRQAFAELFDSLGRRPDLTRLIVLDAQRPTPLPAASHRALAHFQERIRRVVAEGQGNGYFRDEADPDRAAQQAVVLAYGYYAFERILEDLPDPERARRWRDAAADLLLRALSW